MVEKAFTLWAKRVNQGGGLLQRPIRLILHDDQSHAAKAKDLYRRLIREERVDLVLSPYGTPLTMAATEVTEEAGMVMLACAASGEKIWQRGYRYVFGVCAPARRYLIGFLDLAARHGLFRVGILSEKGPFTESVGEGARTWAGRFGLQVVFDALFAKGARELPPLLGASQKARPDALILCMYPPQAIEALAIMGKIRFRPKGLAITVAPALPDFCTLTGHGCEGVFGPSQWEPNERVPFPGTGRFVSEFVKAFGKLPSYHAASAYAACEILERGIRHNQSLDQERLRDFILTQDTVTVVGRFKVDHTGMQIGHSPLIIQWQNGTKEIVYPTSMRTAPPQFGP